MVVLLEAVSMVGYFKAVMSGVIWSLVILAFMCSVTYLYNLEKEL
tara:strand:+ start:53 stop:187 length:135 start_codon:yes stop_codon:yes gene_type:complete